MSNTPVTYARRRGKVNKTTMTLRLALSSMKFDAIQEWAKAYRELDSLSSEDATIQLDIIKTKFKSLEKLFEHMFPKIKEIDQETADMVDMEMLEMQEATTVIPIEEQKTEDLLETLNGKPKDQV